MRGFQKLSREEITLILKFLGWQCLFFLALFLLYEAIIHRCLTGNFSFFVLGALAGVNLAVFVIFAYKGIKL